MAMNYEKYCIGVRKFLPEHIPLICEDCFNDWSHDCERCDAIFDPEYYKTQSRKVEKNISFASVLKGKIDDNVEESIYTNKDEDIIHTDKDEFTIHDENTEYIIHTDKDEFTIHTDKDEFPEDSIPTVSKDNDLKSCYFGDKAEILEEEPKKKKRKNKKKKRIAAIVEEPDLKKQKINDEIDNLPVIEKPKRWYIDWLFSKKWDYFIGKPVKKKPFTSSFSVDYQIYTVILGLIAIGIHIWDKEFTHFSSKL